jgi:rSAM/selenodomain-associated transferase 1
VSRFVDHLQYFVQIGERPIQVEMNDSTPAAARPASGGAGDRLILFARAPVIGSVKTRIAASLGAESALGAHLELFGTVVRNLESVSSVAICATPDDALGMMEIWRRPGWELWPQGGGDLGERLARAFRRGFDAGAGRVVIIGSDCPDVRPAHIEQAWTALRTLPAVFGPARDGGYWLIGLSKMVPEFFAGMPWSGERLLRATLAVAQQQNLSFELLETLGDIDTATDWLEFKTRARRAGGEL